MLKVTSSKAGDVGRIALSGAIDGSESCRDIYQAIGREIEGGGKRIVLDASGVEWVNSMGVGFLVAASVSAVRQDVLVRLFGLRPRVDTVLRACGVVPHVWKAYATEEEALGSF
jgi:anti-anti-sigma factor